MFEVRTQTYHHTAFISDGNKYLHSDGSITKVTEYFETSADAQRVLDKFYPEPEHVWEHGDVFKNHAFTFIYLKRNDGVMVANVLHTGGNSTPEFQMRPAAEVKFLFNIKEKL